MMDEISVDTPCDVPEKVPLLYSSILSLTDSLKLSKLGRSGFILLKVEIK